LLFHWPYWIGYAGCLCFDVLVELLHKKLPVSAIRVKKILHIQVIPKLTGVQRVSLEILKSLPPDEYDKYVLFSNNDVNNTLKSICKEALFSM
jgi:hypothetical protein